jgi:hypothetical protein
MAGKCALLAGVVVLTTAVLGHPAADETEPSRLLDLT